MSEPVKAPVVDEADKPFYLSLLASIIFVAIVAMGGIGAYFAKDALVEFAKWAGTSEFGLMAMSWGWYFKEKK